MEYVCVCVLFHTVTFIENYSKKTVVAIQFKAKSFPAAECLHPRALIQDSPRLHFNIFS